MTSRVEQGLTSIGSGLERMTTGLLDGIGRAFEHATDALSLIAIPVADGVVSIVRQSTYRAAPIQSGQ
jgi:phage-related protein